MQRESVTVVLHDTNATNNNDHNNNYSKTAAIGIQGEHHLIIIIIITHAEYEWLYPDSVSSSGAWSENVADLFKRVEVWKCCRFKWLTSGWSLLSLAGVGRLPRRRRTSSFIQIICSTQHTLKQFSALKQLINNVRNRGPSFTILHLLICFFANNKHRQWLK